MPSLWEIVQNIKGVFIWFQWKDVHCTTCCLFAEFQCFWYNSIVKGKAFHNLTHFSNLFGSEILQQTTWVLQQELFFSPNFLPAVAFSRQLWRYGVVSCLWFLDMGLTVRSTYCPDPTPPSTVKARVVNECHLHGHLLTLRTHQTPNVNRLVAVGQPLVLLKAKVKR